MYALKPPPLLKGGLKNANDRFSFQISSVICDNFETLQYIIQWLK